MNVHNRKYWTLLIVALVLMLGGSLLGSWINTGAGAATVQDIKIYGENGEVISAYLYTPKSATADNPAPGILAIEGGNNQKDFMANTALELARHGYVVLSYDMDGHGYSSPPDATYSAFATAGNGIDAMNYLRSLPNVDMDNIGMIGMSLGGVKASRIGQAAPNDYKAIFLMDSNCFDACESLHNVAIARGTAEEMSIFDWQTTTEQASLNSPILMATLGTTEPVKAGHLYGSIADGTGRILYHHWGDHAESHDDPTTIRDAISWFGMTLKGGSALPNSSLIFGWKLLGTGSALFGAMLFLFPMGALLLQTSYFKPLVDEVPVFKGFKGIGWWIGALLTTALGPITYHWVSDNTGTWLPSNSLWPQDQTNIYMVWSVIVGVIAVILILFNHFVFTKKQGATAVNYGLTSEGNVLDWGKIWKALLLAACILLPIYVILVFTSAVWKVDFRFWILALKPMSPLRFQAFLGYLIPFAIYFVPQGILFAGFLREKDGKVSLVREMVVNSIMLTLGVVIWLLLVYIPLFSGQPAPFFSSGVQPIYFIPFVVLWPLVACLYTYFFRKTGRVYVGVFLVTLFIVWYNAAFASFSLMP
jgi:uncharacterized protein